MIKLLGLWLVFFSFAGTGCGMARGLELEWKVAKELLLLVRRIGSEVRCYKRPLPEIYAGFESEHLGKFLKTLARYGAAAAFAELPTDPAVSRVCLPFFEQMGKCSAEECELLEGECVARLGELINGMEQAVAEKGKVYRSLGLAGGAVAVILLI
ncbi:MAG: hypothetical protein E7599_01990 [Ruminococcaceae bacterium]|nr:hypothetical protein [Oscillospiraceae bacterium]